MEKDLTSHLVKAEMTAGIMKPEMQRFSTQCLTNVCVFLLGEFGLDCGLVPVI